MSDTILTQDGYNKIVEELNYLKEVRRQEVAVRLRAAIEGGGDDLLENAEYEAARNEQSFVEGKINDLEYLVATARVVEEVPKAGEVQVGSEVVIREEGETESETYYIVGTPEVNPSENKISNESPIGKAVMGHKKGDVVEVSAPAGSYKVKIIKIK